MFCHVATSAGGRLQLLHAKQLQRVYQSSLIYQSIVYSSDACDTAWRWNFEIRWCSCINYKRPHSITEAKRPIRAELQGGLLTIQCNVVAYGELAYYSSLYIFIYIYIYI